MFIVSLCLLMKPLLYILTSLFAGLLLQVLCGGIRPSVVAFPLNVSIIFALLATLWVVEGEWGEKTAVRTFRSPRMACGLLIAVDARDAEKLLDELQQCDKVPGAAIIGHVEKEQGCSLYVK